MADTTSFTVEATRKPDNCGTINIKDTTQLPSNAQIQYREFILRDAVTGQQWQQEVAPSQKDTDFTDIPLQSVNFVITLVLGGIGFIGGGKESNAQLVCAPGVITVPLTAPLSVN